MDVRVDFSRCEGHGLCVGEAPEVFELGDDGTLRLLNESPPPDLRSAVEAACAGCPTGAIQVSD